MFDLPNSFNTSKCSLNIPLHVLSLSIFYGIFVLAVDVSIARKSIKVMLLHDLLR